MVVFSQPIVSHVYCHPEILIPLILSVHPMNFFCFEGWGEIGTLLILHKSSWYTSIDNSVYLHAVADSEAGLYNDVTKMLKHKVSLLLIASVVHRFKQSFPAGRLWSCVFVVLIRLHYFPPPSVHRCQSDTCRYLKVIFETKCIRKSVLFS